MSIITELKADLAKGKDAYTRERIALLKGNSANYYGALIRSFGDGTQRELEERAKIHYGEYYEKIEMWVQGFEKNGCKFVLDKRSKAVFFLYDISNGVAKIKTTFSPINMWIEKKIDEKLLKETAGAWQVFPDEQDAITELMKSNYFQ